MMMNTFSVLLLFIATIASIVSFPLVQEACPEGQEDCQPSEPHTTDPAVQKAMEFRTFLLTMFDAVDESMDFENYQAQEHHIVSALLKYVGMDPFLFGKRLGAQDGNWLEELHRRTLAIGPPEFFKVWDENPPTMEEINIIITIDDQAVELAQMEGEDGRMYVDQDVMIQKAFLPFRHRGYTPTLLDTFCRVVIGPIKSVSFAVPSNKVLDKIAEYGPLIEVGAGTGYWSAVLQQRGVDIVAHDTKPPTTDKKTNAYFWHSYTDVLPGDCVSVFSDMTSTTRTLLMVWPNNPDNEDNDEEFYAEGLLPVWDTDCLESFVAAGGTTVIYVGEREENIHILPDAPPESGLCASRRFQNMLKERFDLVEQMDIPRWYYSDDLTIWKLKKEDKNEVGL